MLVQNFLLALVLVYSTIVVIICGVSLAILVMVPVNNQSLNRNIGKYNLPHIWYEVLINNSN